MHRHIVLTGVTRGLGRALLTQFDAFGYVVSGCGRDAAVLAKLRAQQYKRHDFAAVDVADSTAVERWAAHVLERHGPPDLLLNNAALMNDPAPLWKISATEFSRLVDVNIKGIANVIRAFGPAMVARKKGVIVNFSSGWGRSVDAGVAPYCATKWAVEGLTKALAAELPEGMAAVPFNPGVIDTAMLRQCWADGAAAFPKAEKWAEKAAAFLLRLGPKDNGVSLSVREFED